MSNSKPSKRGGKRPGAGRPPGSKNTLGYGEVRAIKAAKLRLPEGVDPEAAALAGEALQKTVAVMRGDVHYLMAPHVLKAATRIREEVCGPVEQKHKHDVSVSIAVVDPYAEDRRG